MNEGRVEGVALAWRLPVYEIRNPNDEIRGNPNDEGNPKSERQLQNSSGLQFPKARSPSPLASPSGRGEPRTAVEQLQVGARFRNALPMILLSLRERAGVRGKGSCEHQSGATFLQPPPESGNLLGTEEPALNRCQNYFQPSGFGFPTVFGLDL